MTTLLIDYNNISMMKCFNKEVDIESKNPNYQMWEFLVFETIYDYIRKFKNITEVIIAKDSKDSWRKIYFPRYKEARKETRAKKEIDWETFYYHMDKLFFDLKTFFPFKCISIDKCEADDIIGVIVLNSSKNLIVLSSDQDYKQIIGTNRRVYSPYTQKFLECSDPKRFILEACLKGQAKDSIFNAITPNDYPSDFRKPPFGDVKVKKWIDTGLDVMLNKEIKYNKDGYKGSILPLDGFKRNSILMDFSKIPKTLSSAILKCYNNYQLSEIKDLYNFFKNKGWTRFLNEFELTENKLLTLY